MSPSIQIPVIWEQHLLVMEVVLAGDIADPSILVEVPPDMLSVENIRLNKNHLNPYLALKLKQLPREIHDPPNMWLWNPSMVGRVKSV